MYLSFGNKNARMTSIVNPALYFNFSYLQTTYQKRGIGVISVKYFIAMQTNLLEYHSDNKNITNHPIQFPFACLNHPIK